MIRHLYFKLTFFFFLPLVVSAQLVTYSDYDREDKKDINFSFDIIGKMNNNILVYKNIRWKHKLSIYDTEMKEIEKMNLDFVPEKTFNVDFVTYPNFFYMIYQYQKYDILNCMGVKMDENGKKVAAPFVLDTTSISFFADSKIYSTIYSEDKKKIMVFKIQKRFDLAYMVTLLFDDQLKLIKKSRQVIPFNERHDSYGDFLLDNDGNFVFTMGKHPGLSENISHLQLVIKKPLEDTFAFHDINLDKNNIDEVKLKIDNLNNRYIINSFYYSKDSRGIEGMFSCTWEKANEKQNPSVFNVFEDSFRAEAHTDGLLRFAFNEFYIRQILVKKDGGFLLTAEDYSSQKSGFENNSWNRWNYMNNPSSYTYYSNNPYYGYYRPLNGTNSFQDIRYYSSNIIVLSIDNKGKVEWSEVIHKDQFDDNEEDFLSFSTMNAGGEIHFLFNIDKKFQLISDQSVTADGTIKRNATLKSYDRGYGFMARYCKQVGAKQVIIPCSYRGFVCFAKVDF